MTDPEDVVGCTAIIESIKAQWATADQEIFVAAIILNPFYQSTPFTALQFLTNAGIHSMLGCLWQHFFLKNHHLNSTSKSMVICMVPIYFVSSSLLVV
jgi:hypothetical protein